MFSGEKEGEEFGDVGRQFRGLEYSYSLSFCYSSFYSYINSAAYSSSYLPIYHL